MKWQHRSRSDRHNLYLGFVIIRTAFRRQSRPGILTGGTPSWRRPANRSVPRGTPPSCALPRQGSHSQRGRDELTAPRAAVMAPDAPGGSARTRRPARPSRPAPGIARITSSSAFAACRCASPAPCDASSSHCILRWALAGWQWRSLGAQGVSVLGCGYGVGTIAGARTCTVALPIYVVTATLLN